MRKNYTIHKKRKYTKKNKIKKSKNKIKYTKNKKKTKTKIKIQTGGGDDKESGEYDPYDEIDDLGHLREIIRDKDAELEEQAAQLQQAAELGQGLLAKNEQLELQLNKEGADSENLSEDLKGESYERTRLEQERKELHENITARQEELQELREDLERRE